MTDPTFGGNDNGPQPQGGMNPAWNDILGAIPSEHHEKLIPHLQSFDQSYQSKMQEATKSYEGYQDFVDNKIDPEHIKIALNLAQALEDNPQAIYEALHQDFGQKNPQEQQDSQNNVLDNQPNDDNPYAELPPQFVKEFQQLKEANETMQQILLHQHNEGQQAQEDAELNEYYNTLMEQDPLLKELNKDGAAEPFINSLVMAGADQKEISEKFADFVDKVASYHNRPKPPTMLGAGGFMPEHVTKPSQLTSDQRDQMAVQMLMHAKGA